MMSTSVDFREPKKKSYKEKDFYILMTIELSRLYVNKENSLQRIWGNPPIEWDQEKLGPWRSPTGKEKDSLSTLRKKCDYLIEHMPVEKSDKVNKVRALIETVKINNKFAHDAVCTLHFKDQLMKFNDDLPRNGNELSSVLPMQEIIDLMEECIKKIGIDKSSNKRSMKDDATHTMKKNKKPKLSVVTVPMKKVTNPDKKLLRPIMPKPSPSHSVLYPLQVVQNTPVLSCSATMQPVSSNSLVENRLAFPSQDSVLTDTNLSPGEQTHLHSHSSCITIPYSPEINVQDKTQTISQYYQSSDNVSLQERPETHSGHESSYFIRNQDDLNSQILSTDTGLNVAETSESIDIDNQENLNYQIPSINTDAGDLNLIEFSDFMKNQDDFNSQILSTDSGLNVADTPESIDNQENINYQIPSINTDADDLNLIELFDFMENQDDFNSQILSTDSGLNVADTPESIDNQENRNYQIPSVDTDNTDLTLAESPDFTKKQKNRDNQISSNLAEPLNYSSGSPTSSIDYNFPYIDLERLVDSPKAALWQEDPTSSYSLVQTTNSPELEVQTLSELDKFLDTIEEFFDDDKTTG